MAGMLSPSLMVLRSKASAVSQSPQQSPLSPQHLDRGRCVCTSDLQEQKQAGSALVCCRGSAEGRGGDAAFTSPCVQTLLHQFIRQLIPMLRFGI